MWFCWLPRKSCLGSRLWLREISWRLTGSIVTGRPFVVRSVHCSLRSCAAIGAVALPGDRFAHRGPGVLAGEAVFPSLQTLCFLRPRACAAVGGGVATSCDSGRSFFVCLRHVSSSGEPSQPNQTRRKLVSQATGGSLVVGCVLVRRTGGVTPVAQ